jgi:hypothetical protein
MPDRYVPPGAQAAMQRAGAERARYQQARAAIRKDKTTNKGQKRRELDRLQEVYARRQQENLAAYRAAYEQAEYQAIVSIVRPQLAEVGGRFMKDSFAAHRQRLRDAPLDALVAEYYWAKLAHDDLLMKVCAGIALQRRTPNLPGDAASKLVARYANERLENDTRRYLDPKASVGWETLQALDQRTPADVMAETSVFSVSSTPEPVEEPNVQPVHPRDAARQKIEQLYPANGQASSEPPSA